MFKFDTHVHTSEASPCGNVTAAKTVELYYDKGYNGLCITDHYNKNFFANINGDWSHKIDCYLKGYYNALSAGRDIDFQVLLGMEIKFDNSNNEYLIYGVTEGFLYKNPELYKLDLSTFRYLIKNEGMHIYQAHPFRPNIVVADINLIDGIEVYNGNPRHNSKNNEAYNFARKNNIRMISGSDCHEICDVARGGICTDSIISSNMEFLRAIMSNDFELITS